MTNRFECDKGSRIIIDNETKLHYIMTLDWECSLVTKLLNRFADENEQLKEERNYFERKKCEYFNKYNKKHLDNIQLKEENDKLKSENKRLTDKLNKTALEFLNHNMVTMGKATEISEMCYSDFLKFRKENGNPMELQE